MGWLTKIESISIFLVTVAILFGSFVEPSSPDCNLLSPTKGTISVDPGETYVYMSAINLNLKNRTFFSCSWNISQRVEHSFFELSRVVLSSKDNLTVTGYHVEKDNNSSVILYQGSGSALPGLISTVGCSFITVDLKLSNDYDVVRTYSTAFYWNADLVQLTKDSGSFSFPLNINGSKITNQFSLQPDNEYSDRLIMLNFTQLPENYSFSLDGVQYNNKNPPPAIYFQSGSLPLKFAFAEYSASPILMRYWLVSAGCSGIENLKADDTRPIPYPNESYRKQQLITDIKCAKYFIAPINTKFQLLINSSLSGLAYPGDSVNIYSQDGKLELGLNAPAVMYFRTIENFLSGNQYLVVYDSPYSSDRNSDFDPPSMKVIPSTQAATYVLSKDLSVTLDKNNKKIVHVLYSQDFTSKIVADFGGASIKPGQINIEIYNTEGENSEPIAVLGQFPNLPLVIPSNTPIMRVVYSGTILPLKVTYRLVEANNSCQLLSTFSSTFEVRGGQSNSFCSWFIPQSVNKTIVVNPTIVKLPQGKNLILNVFAADKTVTKNFSGPINDFYFPDIFLSNTQAYEFILDTANVSKDDLHFFIVAKKNYINETIKIEPTEKVSTVKSANYPGYYPVGVAENWAFNGTNQSFALVSFEDVHLVGDHRLSFVANDTNLSLNGDPDLTKIPDYLVRFPFSISLESKNYNFTSLSNRGFKVGIEYPGLADNIAVKESAVAVINFLSVNNVSSNPLSIWKVTANDSSSVQSDSILLINVTLAEGLDKTKANLNIYDSLSMRSQSIHFANGSLSGTTGFFVGSIKTAFIVYNYTDSLATKSNFSLSITIQTEKCSNSKNYTTKCQKTDRCITDMMICNGIDECGDYTDELFCKGNRPPQPPTPTPASGGGVSVLVVLFILMPLSAVLGIVGYIYLPQFLLRIRRGRYSEFRDLSEVS